MIDATENLTDFLILGVEEAGDGATVLEIYPSDTTPTADGFDPNDALLRYAAVSGVTFFGASYTRLVKSFGRAKRTISAEINTSQATLDNETREASQFEFTTGFEGLIYVLRLISRSNNEALEDSIVLFSGRLERPETGTREQLPLTAKFILNSTDNEIPRRKFSPNDEEGRHQTDVLFEGFPFMPQNFTVTYSVRQRAGGILGLLGFKKTVTQNLMASSFSDIDASKYLCDGFGRVQVALTHIGYADRGTIIHVTSAVMQGEIYSINNLRTDDTRFSIESISIIRRYGSAGETTGLLLARPDRPLINQTWHPESNWIANGRYSRTAMVFCKCLGSNVQTTEPAPNIIAVVMAKIVTVPDGSGDWNTYDWSDNAAAITRHILTGADYFNLDANWIDDASFLESYNFNKEIIFDYSFSDLLFIPNTLNFVESGEVRQNLFLSTGHVGTDYFKYILGDATAEEAFLKSPYYEPYDTLIPIEPILVDPPPGGGQSSNLTFFLRRRYTLNAVASEVQKTIDFLHNVVFVSSRMFLSQNSKGQIKLNNKKPVDFALSTAIINAGDDTIAVDDVKPWVDDVSRLLLIDPHTTASEVREVTDANYSTAQNSVTLTASSDIEVTAFSGCDGAGTPATAVLLVKTVTPSTLYSFTLDGVQVDFIPTSADTEYTIAAFIYGTINAHPVLRRKFVATWSAAEVTIKGKFGSLVLNADLELSHSAPLANPTAAPVLTAAGGGTFSAGVYSVAYSYRNHRGQTLISPYDTVTLTVNQKIDVDAVTLPAGATDIVWYVSVAAGSARIRYHSANDGSAFTIDELPKLNAPIPPDFNRTGAEVMRVCASFSDRQETRANLTRSNVLKASYKWRLGNREKAVNRIDLKYRDSTQDYRLIELRIRDDENINKTKKINNLEVNGQGIDNYHQAYRIASGIFTEKRDANFLYEWSSDRLALLLEEGDVVCITDDGSEVYNLPVRIEAIEFDNLISGFPTANFTGRIYSTTLYDDSISERSIPVIIETGEEVDYV